MVQLGTSGCQFASPLESAEFALAKAISYPNTDPDNGGFVREDAVLAVIVDAVLPRCDSSSSGLPCWQAAPDAICPPGTPDVTFSPDPTADASLVGGLTSWWPAW